MQNRSDPGNTPFDDVFKTMQERMPFLMISVLNDVFGTDYDLDSENVVQLNAEHHTYNGKRYEDSRICIAGKKFHLECQSTNDSKIALRQVEYDLADALQDAYAKPKYKRQLILARSCVLNLRGSRSRVRNEIVCIQSPDHDTLKIKVPVQYVSSYPPEEILQKKLFLFIPFYAMRYEMQLKDPDKQAFPEKLKQELCFLLTGVRDYFHDTERAYCSHLLYELTQRVLNALVPEEHSRMRDEVENFMGGHSLTTPTTIILDQGIQIGIQQESIKTERQRQRAEAALKENAILKEKLKKYERT